MLLISRAESRVLREAAVVSIKTWFSLAVSPPGSPVNSSHLMAESPATLPVPSNSKTSSTANQNQTSRPPAGKNRYREFQQVL